jgi:hypothetical protein
MTGIFQQVPYGNRLTKTLEIGQAIAQRFGTSDLGIKMSRWIKTTWNAQTKADEARAVRAWVQQTVKYFSDPHGAELVSDPIYTMKNGGDCDDLATLAAALLIALGHNARLAAVKWQGRQDFTHAVVADLTAEVIVDPVSVEPEIWPPAPYIAERIIYLTPSGEVADLSGIFGKIHKAFSKVFTKVFKPKTLLGKILDPLGASSRNLKTATKVADVVGTAVATFYTAGLAAGVGGGFLATTAGGAKVLGGLALKGLTAAKAGGAAVAKAVLPAVVAAASNKSGAAPQQMAAAVGMDPYGAQQMAYDPAMYYGASGGYGGGGGGAMIDPGGMTYGADGVPGATVEVTDTMPKEGPGLGTVALVAGVGLGLYFLTKKKGK